ncbi:MAG: spore maturation protein [Clostridiaceae bacterium]|nr:spore maturation protein [Clostridiaceae bacterium]
MIDFISKFSVPGVIFFIVVIGYLKKVPVFDAFVEGAKEGASAAFEVLPVMVGILTAVSLINASGLIDILTSLVKGPLSLLGVPAEIVPILLIRPFSGSASLGLFTQQIKLFGADTYLGRTLSTIMGSSETVLYTLPVYFGAANVKDTRHAVAASLIASYTGMLVSIYICKFI